MLGAARAKPRNASTTAGVTWPMETESRPFHPGAPWVWAGLSFLAWFGSLWVALPLAGLIPPVIVNSGAPDGSLRWDLAVFLSINGSLSLAASIGIGRLIFGRRFRVAPLDFVVPAIGLALAIAIELALHGWAQARYSYYDWDFVRWTAGLSALVVVTAVATFGVLIAPSRSSIAPRTWQVVGASLVLLIVASNVPGLGDGIEPESWPLAVLIGLSALYVCLVVAAGWRDSSH